MRLSELESQLKNKKKTVSELADIISLRTDRNPNFSILLGAGCSISSGIKSASALIYEWRSELSPGITSVEEQRKHLRQQYPDWYDPNKEYSSLFEKKFDLQRHRRMFVEREVSGKTPSIGYAYLTSLVNDDYFHTIFTTNFDDLINEAFYLYSDQRPIVCAHDSSINSITVTSSRPKIIKLHGDYLFDDIKATARETESLEQNMKAKFAEFAKDFGLIVIGYSGCDRSIMDAISVLLKNDDYFKNGIYWCIRKDSEISDDLKKLLWKDKVYFVEVEGFDEVFAEMHSRFNDEDSIPISTSSVSRRPTEIINRLLNSEYFKNSPSLTLRKTYEQLTIESKRTTLMDLILPRDKGESNNSSEQLSDDELITRFELQKLNSAGEYREAIEKGKVALQTAIKPTIRTDIYRQIISAYRSLDDLREAATIADELILEQPFLASHHLLKAEILSKSEEKLYAINKAIEVNPHWYRGYFRKASLLYALATDSFGQEKEKHAIEAKLAVDMGIEKDPSFDNPCWELKFDIVSTCDKGKANKDIDQKKIIDALNTMNPQSSVVLGLRLELLSAEKNQVEIKQLISEIDSLKKRTPSSVHAELDGVKLKGLRKIDDSAYISKELESVRSAHDLESEIDLAVSVASLLREKFGKDQDAIDLLRKIYLSSTFDQTVVSSLISALIDNDETPEAERIYNKTCKHMGPSSKHNSKLELLEAKSDFEGALTEIQRRTLLTGTPDHERQTYFLIKNSKYSDAAKLLRSSLESINFSLDAKVLIVNYELACKKQRLKYDHNRLEKVLSFDSSPNISSVIYSVLGKKPEMIANLNKAISKDKTFRFEAKRWPAFDEFRDDPEFIKAISLST